VTTKLYDGLLEEANRDLQAAKVLVKNSLYSSTLYHLEQVFEKSIKSLYSYYSIIHERKSEADVL
jgi:HEPN domain-containing protein